MALAADRQLGATGIAVSALAFGAAPLGDVYGEISERDAEEAVHAAIDGGIRLFDVAPYYGATLAETRLGRALDGRRSEVVLATKCGRNGLRDFDFSADGLRRSVEGSLRRLRTDQIDLLQLHDVEFGDVRQIVEESIPTLLGLVAAGVTRAIGVTGLPLPLLSRLARTTPIHTVLSYCHGSLLTSDLTTQLLPVARAGRVGVLNASPLHMGLLTGSPPPPWHPAPAALRETAQRLERCCRKWSRSLPAVALRYAAELPVDTTILGLASAREVEAALEALEQPIPTDLREELAELAAPTNSLGWFEGRPENQV